MRVEGSQKSVAMIQTSNNFESSLNHLHSPTWFDFLHFLCLCKNDVYGLHAKHIAALHTVRLSAHTLLHMAQSRTKHVGETCMVAAVICIIILLFYFYLLYYKRVTE